MDRPNVILIITDQQRYDTIGALGYPHVDTPHLDRLAKEGMRFTSFYASQAVCSASSCASFPASLASVTTAATGLAL